MHPQSRKIFNNYLKKTKELNIPIIEFSERNNLIQQLVLEFSHDNEELRVLLLEEIRDIRNFYQQGRIDALQDLSDAQEKLKNKYDE